MGLEEVKDEVLNAARSEAAKVKKQAEKQAAEIAGDADQKIDQYRKKAELRLQQNIDLLRRRELTQANLQVRNNILNAKKEAIDTAFATALEKLVNATKNNREKILGKLLRKAQREIKVSHVLINPNDTTLVKYSHVEDMPQHGIMAENEDHSVRIDYSFETLLAQMKERKLAEVANKLFGNAKA